MKTRKKTRRMRISLLDVLLAAGTLVGLVVIGFGIYICQKPLTVEFFENAEVGVNETAYNDQFVKSIKNGSITTEKTLIDTSNLGKVNVSLAVKPDFGAEEVFTYSVSVVDHESPSISFAGRLETDVGHEIDLLEGVSVTDNSGEKITAAVEGSYDIHTVGDYQLTYVAYDSSRNRAEETFTLSVTDRESPVITFTGYREIFVGNDIDLLEGVSAADNSGEEITVTVEGSYDIHKAGTYELKLVAYDSSLNKTEETLTLNVKAAPAPAPTPSPSTGQTTNNGTGTAGTASFVTSKGFQGETRNGVTYIDGYLIANKTYSLPASYGDGLTAETMSAFNQMASAAWADGLNIYISSGFRSYDFQYNLYNSYVRVDGTAAADTYSARAGHSEHQSGLAFDVNWINDAFAGTPEGIWLDNNCYKYGFILRYPQGKSNETGYKYEPWHFRYVGTELAAKLYNGGDWITMEDYFGITSVYQ